MATLFFEGFDKGIVFNKLDPNYWSSQYKLFPKYSFGGYLPYTKNVFANTWDFVGATYVYNSPNGGILPLGQHTDGYSRYNGYGSDNYAGTQYPEFGTPPGFLAFSNIDIDNFTNIEVPTYLQASGFPLPSGDTTYFSMRCLGLESRRRDSSPYPHRHTFFSYNSGNIPQLTVNVVQVTGNSNLISLNNEYSTLALEIQQNDHTIGYFDLNISQTLTRYRIASVYNSSNTILTIADTISSPVYASIRSRWSHLEFAIDQSTNPATLSINLEDINLPVINNDIDVSRESWETSLPISGFDFNNLRFYNRTYSSAISVGQDLNYYSVQPTARYAAYYMFGQNLLLDDMALIDNVGEPSYFLGSTARVISMIPGNGSLLDNNGITDGVLDWSTNSSAFFRGNRGGYPEGSTPSHRKALLSLDNDDNAIEAINSGTIDAVSFTPFNYDVLEQNGNIQSDIFSRWRTTFNDAVGGIKLYNSARKKYLDTKFVNIFVSGVNDTYENSVSLLLHGDILPVVDSTRTPKVITNNNTAVRGDNIKFGEGSLYFNNSSSYLTTSHSDLAQNQFTIECWAYFNSHNESVALFERKPTNLANTLSNYYSFYLNTSGVVFQRINNCDKVLLFNQVMQTGVWNHVAVVRTPESDLCAYLNGVRNTTYKITNCENKPNGSETYNYVSNDDYGPSFSRENQGSYNGKYSLFFVNGNNLVSSQPINDWPYTTSTNLKIGSPSHSVIENTDDLYSSVSLLLKADDGLVDLSNNTKTITNNGVTRSTIRSRFEDKSFYFTGGKTLSFNNSDDFNFGTDDFTIDFWFLLTDTTAGQSYNILNGQVRCYVAMGGGGDPNIPVAHFSVTNSGVEYTFYGVLFMAAGYPNNERRAWYHVSLVRYNTEFFAYIVPQSQTYTPPTACPYGNSSCSPWPPRITTGQAVSSSIGNTIPNLDFPVNMNNFTLGDSNTGVSRKLYIDNFRITKGHARIKSRLQLPIAAPTNPYPSWGSSISNSRGVYIEEYRITYGVSRYNENFTPPSEQFKAQRDNYLNIGPDYNVNKTVYQTYQHYMLKNPATNQPWKLPEVSGITLGVKKL
jgi:hypothetical protein